MTQKRGPWSQEEDATLLANVTQQGPCNWVHISHLLRTRTAKQCRERYHQNLKPSLNHSPISAEEGEIIERAVQDMGKRWAEIARRLPGRSDNAVKNWWNGGMNRRRRMFVRRDGVNRSLAQEIPEQRHNLTASRPLPPPLTGQRPLPAFGNPSSMERPLVSPARSDISMQDSLGEAPSLISDHGSPEGTTLPHEHLHHSQRQLPPPPRGKTKYEFNQPMYTAGLAHHHAEYPTVYTQSIGQPMLPAQRPNTISGGRPPQGPTGSCPWHPQYARLPSYSAVASATRSSGPLYSSTGPATPTSASYQGPEYQSQQHAEPSTPHGATSYFSGSEQGRHRSWSEGSQNAMLNAPLSKADGQPSSHAKQKMALPAILRSDSGV